MVGYEREMLDIFNIFVPRSSGQYIFSSIANFQNRDATRCPTPTHSRT